MEYQVLNNKQFTNIIDTVLNESDNEHLYELHLNETFHKKFDFIHSKFVTIEPNKFKITMSGFKNNDGTFNPKTLTLTTIDDNTVIIFKCFTFNKEI